MSYADGIAAINLDMPKRVPRTEYSAESHWELIRTVTAIDVDVYATDEVKARASAAFMKAWDYDFRWNTLIHNQVFGDIFTRMGHANYSAGAEDFDASTHCPFTGPEQVLSFDPWGTYGRIDGIQAKSDFEANYNTQRDFFPDAVNMTGTYVTLVSGLIEIFGWDMMLMALGTDPRRFGELTNRYASWIQQYFDALADADVPVIMVHDDIVWTSGPFCHPDWYREYVFPNYKKYFAPLIESGKKIAFTSDGTYTMFVDDIAACGVHGFVMEPTTDMAYVADKYGRTHFFIGNVDTRVLLSGSREDIRDEVQRCMDIGKQYPGFFMAVGNHIPANTPVKNALYYNDVYQELASR